MKVYVSCILLLLPATTLMAQGTTSNYEIGARISGMVYQGDLTSASLGSIKTARPGIGITVAKTINHHWQVRLNADYGRLAGNDALYGPDWRQHRNFRFSASSFELAAHAVYHLGHLNGSSNAWKPYVFGGAGIGLLNIKRDYSNFNANFFETMPTVAAGLAEDLQQSPPRTVLLLPVGIGIRRTINDRISLYAEAGYRWVFTDYLDGFSKSVNDGRQDHYSNVSVGITYRLGRSAHGCPRY